MIMGKITVADLEAMHNSGELAGKTFTADQLTNETYHAGPGISHSGLKTLGTKSPEHYRYETTIGRKPPTDAMKAGTRLHMKILEPELFDSTFAVKPSGMSFAKKDGKQWRDEQLDAGKEIIAYSDVENIFGMAQAIKYHPVAGPLLNLPMVCEQSIYWNDKKTGVLCRCRPDIVAYSDGSPLMIDLKKTQDCSLDAISKAINNFSHHTQAPFYARGYKAVHGVEPAFLFIFVEEKPPHGVRVVTLVNGDIDPQNPNEGWAYDFGAMANKHRLDVYAQCLEADRWPGYQTNGIEEVDLPRYAYQKEL